GVEIGHLRVDRRQNDALGGQQVWREDRRAAVVPGARQLLLDFREVAMHAPDVVRREVTLDLSEQQVRFRRAPRARYAGLGVDNQRRVWHEQPGAGEWHGRQQ